MFKINILTNENMNRSEIGERSLKETFFENAIKIVFDKNKTNILRKDFIDSIRKEVDIKSIINVCQYKDKNTWFCSFIKELNFSDLIQINF